MSRALVAALAALMALPVAPAMAEDLTFEQIEAIDIDEDGIITIAEYRVFASNAFIELDTDHDNHLDQDEVAGFADEALFAAIDTDGDGRVSRMEFDAHLLADFHAADLDDDGQLAHFD